MSIIFNHVRLLELDFLYLEIGCIGMELNVDGEELDVGVDYVEV
jgi:hypothetical protein